MIFFPTSSMRSSSHTSDHNPVSHPDVLVVCSGPKQSGLFSPSSQRPLVAMNYLCTETDKSMTRALLTHGTCRTHTHEFRKGSGISDLGSRLGSQAQLRKSNIVYDDGCAIVV